MKGGPGALVSRGDLNLGGRAKILGHTIKPGTPEHGTAEYGTPAEQRNTPEQQRNNCTLPGTPVEHPRIPTKYQRNTSGWNTPRTMEPYKTKNNCSVFKKKFKPQNLKVEILFIADINYLFIYFSLFKVGLQVVKNFKTNN